MGKKYTIIARSLTTDDLRNSNIPNRYLDFVRGTIKTEKGCYTITHQYLSAVYHKTPVISLIKSKYSPRKVDKEDIINALLIIKELSNGKTRRFFRKFGKTKVIIDLYKNHTQENVADFFDKYKEYFKEARIRYAYFSSVPGQFIRNISFSIGKLESYLD